MAAQNFPEARLIGTDASKEMVEVARSLNELPDSIHFFHSTAEDLSFPNSSIDVAMTTLSFHHWSDQEVALKGIQKKLRPNGIFILGDIMASGILQPIFALANHGRFNTVRKLEEMIGNAGLKIKKDIPLRRYGGTIRIIVSTKG
jgi:ubiquinone/menaquinone biosynthesis C-methylase UbiE